ncbi:acetyl/propionyl/methylcrotonyl-CoA carboxylase subunit alpha [Actinomadura sp. 6N118]|uniref:acetyl/propionyl/methylcrotonyl-CoA carboxylase subunit alpha n=1 Tax=Actinomadura sp. 6N118 TaxID=3375151 RepID=UPI0037929B16
MFDKVLVANRGEIALRVIRACRELGIRSVAAYSSADEDSLAVSGADEAVRIGPEHPRRSYLSIPAMVEAAALSGADAVHPGYGFLSEEPDFAEVCQNAGLSFIGPPHDVLAQLSDKSRARELMASCGLPLLPGSLQPLRDLDESWRTADQIGYPLIIKAAMGGGGRGMRIVRCPAELPGAFRQACADAHAFFGDGRVYAERFVQAARHVEVQVFCDAYGAVVCLGERDCTIQRRNQKLIEETPAPGLPPALVERICQAAVAGARAARYVGAGTFEFLVDSDHRFYFMEVNCRIQVEHPVTEVATGIDLVQEQIRIAAGERLGFDQSDVRPQGAVIECRVNAEDPERQFTPAPGLLTGFQPPGGPFVRVDTHCFPGMRISAAYDSMLAKVIVWAPGRAEAIARMRRALGEFRIDGPGVHTTAPFLDRVLDHCDFRCAEHTTGLATHLLDGSR